MEDWERGAVSLLTNAASMLRIDAQEWRAREAPDWAGRTRERMIAIAESNEGMARAMVKHVEQLQDQAA